MRVPRATINMGAKGPTRLSMSKADKDFVRGYAACLVAAIRAGHQNIRDISGGLNYHDFSCARVDEQDIKLICAELKSNPTKEPHE